MYLKKVKKVLFEMKHMTLTLTLSSRTRKSKVSLKVIFTLRNVESRNIRYTSKHNMMTFYFSFGAFYVRGACSQKVPNLISLAHNITYLVNNIQDVSG